MSHEQIRHGHKSANTTSANTTDTTRALLDPFSDPDAVAQYAERTPRFVPGFHDMHRMAGIVLAERAPPDARVLILGAGGGLELKALAQMQPGWTFDGVDPSPNMLGLAARTLGDMAPRAKLHTGYIDDAPQGPFDAAVCLLTLHFLNAEERQRTVAEIHRRLKPGAPFVAAHSSFPQQEPARSQWLTRYANFAVASGHDGVHTEKMRAAVKAHLNMLSPEQDENIFRAAGFHEVTPFYAAFTWRGWVAYA